MKLMLVCSNKEFNNGFTIAWTYSTINQDSTTKITYPVAFTTFVRVLTTQYHTKSNNGQFNNSLEPGDITLTYVIVYDNNYGKSGLIVCIGV